MHNTLCYRCNDCPSSKRDFEMQATHAQPHKHRSICVFRSPVETIYDSISPTTVEYFRKEATMKQSTSLQTKVAFQMWN
jgi:hypothetical protein